MEIIRNASVPDGVVNFLPGIGEDLVRRWSVIPMSIWWPSRVPRMWGWKSIVRQPTPTSVNKCRRVIAEMGGKNSIIVDDDADLDEAVVG